MAKPAEILILYTHQDLLITGFSREIEGTFYQRQMGIGLGEIPQQSLSFKIDILAEKPQVIAIAQYAIKPLRGALYLPDLEQTVDKPECADGKG